MLKQAVAAVRGQSHTVTVELDPSHDGVLDATGMTVLGVVGRERYPYVSLGDAEYRVTGDVGQYQLADTPPNGQVWLRTRITRRVDGRPVSEYQVLRTVPVEPGTFATMKARQEKREARIASEKERASRPHIWDALSGLHALAPKPISVLPVGPELSAVAANPGLGLLQKRKPAVVRPASGPVVGPRAILEALASRGVILTPVSGRLLVTAKHVSHEDRQVIEAAAPLLLGVLTEPVLCALCALENRGKAREAITIAVVDVPVCGDHLNGVES